MGIASYGIKQFSIIIFTSIFFLLPPSPLPLCVHFYRNSMSAEGSFVSRKIHPPQRNGVSHLRRGGGVREGLYLRGCVLIPIYQSSDRNVKGSSTSHMCGMCGPSCHPLILPQTSWVTAVRDKTSGHRQLCPTESP